ncbi:hypothetical protein ACFX15_010140 [Malus domestica]
MGWFSTHTFGFPSSNNTVLRFLVAFGCGFDNRQMTFGGPNNVMAGIFGLGGGQRSIVTRLGLPESASDPALFRMMSDKRGGVILYSFLARTAYATRRGADLVLDSDAIFERIDTSVCIGIMPTCDAGPSLLGAFQQTNHRFLFDVKSLKMSFVPEKC